MKLRLYRIKRIKCWILGVHVWFKYVGKSEILGPYRKTTFPYKGGWCGRCGHDATFIESVEELKN